MAQIQNNTDDHNISNILTTNAANKITASDVIADMKTVLNVNLQPNDSESAQIVLTQSAFNINLRMDLADHCFNQTQLRAQVIRYLASL